ncbi:hypothetical protein Poli38472_005173 [Pythium oligandrum]|uniref:Uncharacterized protein n=1 Tax=Pythium oligandrum TaxID=41045 RepID=A0A8K1CH06_PYTOL|nr:hypothetical protein Poli38472_005173 [Pythium oligandrum]|eukprot:TMW62555.1 hypothetical protein Poli38472_005173 [Pythium oligandrum]
MPVGMTLQQLYSQPTFSDAHAGPVSATASTSASPAMTTTATSNAGKRSASPGVDPTRPQMSNSRSPRSSDAGHHMQMQQRGYPEQQQHITVQHYPQYGQLPPPRGFAQYHPVKAANGSEEYALADPLPFEYMRKYQEGVKDQGDHRYPPNQMQYGAENYGPPSPHPSVYESQHAHPPKNVEGQSRAAAYHQGGYPHARPPYHPPAGMPGHYAHGGMQQAHLYGPPPGSMMNMPPHHAYPPMDNQALKKEGAYNGHGVEYNAPPPAPVVPQGASQEAVIKVRTTLKTKYWRNGRRNLQCFPACKVFGDYSSIKIEDLKQHDFMWGKCRGSIFTDVTLNSSVSFDDILILGRVHSLENIPVAFEEAVIRECMLGRMVEPDVMDTMKDQWITGERLPDQPESNTARYEFKPKVWKYNEDMAQGKCKRRNVKYYVQFEAFVLVMSGDRRYYACIGSGMSTSFEVGSSRVLARQKRKAAATGTELAPQEVKVGQAPVATSSEMSMQAMHHTMMPAHSMMPPHGMPPQMYPPSYPGYGAQRALPPPYPQMHHPDANQAGMPPSHHYHYPPVPSSQSAPAPSSSSQGVKRKLGSDSSPRESSERSAKSQKTTVVNM